MSSEELVETLSAVELALERVVDLLERLVRLEEYRADLLPRAEEEELEERRRTF